MRQREAANPDIAGHHALPGEHLENAQNLFALPETVKEHAHRADVDGVRRQPHQMAVQTRKLRQHHARPLCEFGNFQTQQLFRRQTVHQVIRQRSQIIDPVRQRHALLVRLDFEFLLDPRVQVPDIRRRFDNGFAVQFQQQTQHAVRGRVLRTHIEHHRPVPARLLMGREILLNVLLGGDKSVCGHVQYRVPVIG